ncbi:MAG: DNA methyltransferase [Candidatus Zixiibacteriota bacterium]
MKRDLLDKSVSENEVDLSFADVSERDRTKHVHRLHPYLGKFIPQLVSYFLDKYFGAGQTILDPFAGSGTTLVEASILGMNAIGIEISEFNCLITKVKTQKYDLLLLDREVKDVLKRVIAFSKRIVQESNLFPEKENLRTNSKYLNEWFSDRALQEILYYKSLIPNYHYQDILKIILSRSARSARQIPHYDLARPKKPVKTSYYCFKHSRICMPVDEALKFMYRYSYDTIARIYQYQKMRKDVFIDIICGDTRNVTLEREIDGVFTSPPYVGLIDYHDQHRYAYELFGFGDNSDREIGPMCKGQNGNAKASYTQDMISAFRNIRNYLKKDALLFVVANDKYCLYENIFKESGLDLIEVFHRPVTKRTERTNGLYYESIFMVTSR